MPGSRSGLVRDGVEGKGKTWGQKEGRVKSGVQGTRPQAELMGWALWLPQVAGSGAQACQVGALGPLPSRLW